MQILITVRGVLERDPKGGSIISGRITNGANASDENGRLWFSARRVNPTQHLTQLDASRGPLSTITTIEAVDRASVVKIIEVIFDHIVSPWFIELSAYPPGKNSLHFEGTIAVGHPSALVCTFAALLFADEVVRIPPPSAEA